jgi:hypothetical protein
MLEQVASYAGGAVDAGTVEAAFGATGRHYSRGLVDAILAANASAALRIVDEASDAGADMLGLIRGAIGEYRNVLVARIDAGLLARDLSTADADAVIALAASTPQPKVVRGLRLLADALAAGRSSGNPRLELETAVLRLIVQGEDPSLEALATRVALLEGGVAPSQPPAPRARTAAPEGAAPERTAAPPPVRAAVPPERTVAALPEPVASLPEPVASPAAPSAAVNPPAAPTLQQVRSLWDQIRLRVEERSKPLRGPLSRATVDALDASALTISVPDEIQESLLRPRLALVESAVADALRVPLRLVLRNRSARTGDPYQPPVTPARRSAGRRVHESSADDGADEEDAGGDGQGAGRPRLDRRFRHGRWRRGRRRDDLRLSRHGGEALERSDRSGRRGNARRSPGRSDQRRGGEGAGYVRKTDEFGHGRLAHPRTDVGSSRQTRWPARSKA